MSNDSLNHFNADIFDALEGPNFTIAQNGTRVFTFYFRNGSFLTEEEKLLLDIFLNVGIKNLVFSYNFFLDPYQSKEISVDSIDLDCLKVSEEKKKALFSAAAMLRKKGLIKQIKGKKTMNMFEISLLLGKLKFDVLHSNQAIKQNFGGFVND